VPDAARKVGNAERDQTSREVQRPGGAAQLVVDDLDRLVLLGEPGHRLDEVAAGGAVQPRRADDEGICSGGQDRLLAGGFGAAVDRARRGSRSLVVRLVGVAGEHVVGGDVKEARAEVGARLGETTIDG
jgi:hypothetical protein